MANNNACSAVADAELGKIKLEKELFDTDRVPKWWHGQSSGEGVV